MTAVMARPLGAALFAAAMCFGSPVQSSPAGSAAVEAQARPAWLEEAPAARASTPHLEARALPPAPARNGHVTLRVEVTPRQGMRIYAPDVTGYVPLTFSVDVPDGATVVGTPDYPSSVEYVFPPTGERSHVYDGAFTVSQRVRVRSGAGGVDGVTGTLRYQACDDRLCYRPSSVTLRWTTDEP